MFRAILLLFGFLLSSVVGGEPLRVLTYNVLYGFNHGKSPELAAKWIASQKPDIVALQELNRHTQKSLEQIAGKWGHDHAVILKEKGFPVGLTANAPIDVIEKRLEGMGHGCLHAKVRGVHVFVVHLSPSKFAIRMREAEIISGKVRELMAGGESVIVLGDFNCSSRLDRQWLEARPKPEPADDKTVARRAGNADPDFSVMKQFLASGLVDLVHVKQPADELQLGSFPTRLLLHAKTDEQRRNKVWRIDFILADAALAKRCTGAAILRDAECDLISDHYPVRADFKSSQ